MLLMIDAEMREETLSFSKHQKISKNINKLLKNFLFFENTF